MPPRQKNSQVQPCSSAWAHPLLSLQLFMRNQPPNMGCLSCFTLIFLILVLCGVGEGLGGTEECLTAGSVSARCRDKGSLQGHGSCLAAGTRLVAQCRDTAPGSVQGPSSWLGAGRAGGRWCCQSEFFRCCRRGSPGPSAPRSCQTPAAPLGGYFSFPGPVPMMKSVISMCFQKH